MGRDWRRGFYMRQDILILCRCVREIIARGGRSGIEVR